MKKRMIDKYKGKRRVVFAISVLVLAFLYAFKNYSFLIRALSTVALLVAFYLIDHLFDIDFKNRHYVFIILIAFSGFLLSPLYFIYSNYDKVQHLIQPMMLASIVFHMVNKLKLERKWKLFFVFFIVAGSIGIFEIGEYGLDYFFDLKLQGVFLRDIQGLQRYDLLLDRIDDTMIDMSLGLVGALVYIGFVAWFFPAKTSSKRATR